MADEDQEQKTEQASEKKLGEALERGQFAKSPELALLFLLVAALAVFAFTIQSSSRLVADYAISVFTHFSVTEITRDTVTGQLGEVILTVGRAALPILLAAVLAAALTAAVQSGFRLTPEALSFSFDRLDPAAGFSRIFSKNALVRTGIDCLKLIAIGSVLYLGARGLLADPLFSVPVEAAYLGQFLGRAAITFLGRMILALSIVVVISYSYEKFKTQKELMMTKQEVKDERRNADGNAMTKTAMRRMARRLMQRQMLSAVATADVVITNPTHYAVALKYERSKDKAPIVLAKGENRFAMRLKAIAIENGVPIVENKPVARVLFSMAKVGEAIPADLYRAVAEILAVVYRTHRYYFHRLKSRRLEASI
ncbi:MAG TPA: EscU/YscU/HrcU family type III secretion system export apparatus switch protein [Opitutaceae bacterium]